jgi:uncharacterized protein (TIGR02147 family)
LLLDCYQEYRTFLRDTFDRRRTNNASYSLRAYARDLDVSPPQLSCVLRGKKGLSLVSAQRVATNLGLSKKDQERFRLLVEKEDARSSDKRTTALRQIRKGAESGKFLELKLDTYRLVSDWYHYSILELTAIPGVSITPDLVAAMLGLTPAVAKAAIARLSRLGLLKKVGRRWIKSEAHLTTTDGVPSEAIRETNRQLLQKALAALEQQPLDERDFSTVTFAINPEKLPDAKRIIAAFRRQMIGLLETPPQSELYCLAVQLFRLTQDSNNYMGGSER